MFDIKFIFLKKKLLKRKKIKFILKIMNMQVDPTELVQKSMINLLIMLAKLLQLVQLLKLKNIQIFMIVQMIPLNQIYLRLCLFRNKNLEQLETKLCFGFLLSLMLNKRNLNINSKILSKMLFYLKRINIKLLVIQLLELNKKQKSKDLNLLI